MTPLDLALGISLIIASLLVVVGWNHTEAGKLEAATTALVSSKQQQVVDPALIAAASSLPSGLQALNKQQRDSMYLPIEAYARLDHLNEEITNIKDATSQAIIVGAVSSILVYATGWLAEIQNSLYVLCLIVWGMLLLFYFDRGILQVRRIRGLEKINRHISPSTSVQELRDLATEALDRYLT